MQLIETKLPQFPYGPILSTILNAEQGSIFEPLIASGKVNELADPAQIAGLKASLDVAAKDYLKAMRIRRLIQAAYATLFAEVDALVTTGRNGPATPINQPLDAAPARARRIQRHHPGGKSGGIARAGFPLRLRGQAAGGAASGGSAVLGECAAGDWKGVPGGDGLA